MEQASASRRRRGAGHVTQIACTECRKKRAKCDGQTPCGRCVSQQVVECVYEPHIRQSKDDMRSEIEELRQAQRQHQRVIDALVATASSDETLAQLRKGESVDSITQKLESLDAESASNTVFRRSSEQQAIYSTLQMAMDVERSPASPFTTSDSGSSISIPHYTKDKAVNHFSTGSASSGFGLRGQYSSPSRWESDAQARSLRPLIGSRDTSGEKSRSIQDHIEENREFGQDIILGTENQQKTIERWTQVTSDVGFVNHIMSLYFCWEYPTFASLSKEHFLEDYHTGSQRYCSSLLVNTILALGCRFSSRPDARSDPDDSRTAGNHFATEASRLLALEKDKHSLTTIQALGLMSLREASCGRTSQSYYYSTQAIRLAIEIGLHKDSPNGYDQAAEIDHEVRSATFWGAFSLDQAWALSIGKLPQFSIDLRLVQKPAILKHIESSAWVPYTDDGAPLHRPCIQPSNVRSVFKSFAELSEVIHTSLYALYTPGRPVTSKSILDIYKRFIYWYDGLTTVLRLGENFTPSVLFAHMHYQYAVLLLFRPFLKLNITTSHVSPRDICAQASEAIIALVKSYHQLYTLQRTPSFLPYFVLNASIGHMVTMAGSHAGPGPLLQCIEDLKEMSKCHVVALEALDILQYLILHWQVEGMESLRVYDLKQLKEILRARSDSLNQFCPFVENVDMDNRLKPGKGDSPLFWPFPLQGRPILNNEMLERSGFELSNEWKVQTPNIVAEEDADSMDTSGV